MIVPPRDADPKRVATGDERYQLGRAVAMVGMVGMLRTLRMVGAGEATA
jgi:hypothetical protein